MSGAQPPNPTSKLQPTNDSTPNAAGANAAANAADTQKQSTALEEDDEFEDFPVEDWGEEETSGQGADAHLWEESWDDDDENEDFSKVLK